MRLSIETYDLVQKFGYQKAFQLLKAAGFEAVDYSLYWDYEGWLMQDDYREKALAIRKALDETGLVCSQTHAPFHSVAANRKDGIAYGQSFDESVPTYLETIRAMEVSAILGAEHTVVHSVNTPFDVDLLEYNLPFFKSLQPYAEKFGIKIAIENLFRFNAEKKYEHRIGDGTSMNQVYKALDPAWFVLLVDTGHAKMVGIEPQDLIRELTPGALCGLHIQDTDGLKDRHQLPYMGNLDWDAVLKALKDTGYRGDFTFEVNHILEPIPDELAEPALAYCAAVGKYLIAKFNEL